MSLPLAKPKPAYSAVSRRSDMEKSPNTLLDHQLNIPSSSPHSQGYTTFADVTMPTNQPLVLFIDAYDSFSNNIISLLETTLNCAVRTIHIDNPILLSSDAALRNELKHYVAVVCGPGPGHPANQHDIGIIEKIWRLSDHDLIPVLGVCLGFQSLCLEFGADINRLKGPQHGIIRNVTHVGRHKIMGEGTIFEGVKDFKATHYQSLCADIGQTSSLKSKWKPTSKCSELVPLAYAENDLSIPNDSGVKDEMVLVAVRHISKPFWALQYHPESICTTEESNKVVRNWFKQAQDWNRSHGRVINAGVPSHGKFAVRENLLGVPNLDDSTTRTSEALKCYTRTIPLFDYISVPEIAEAVQHMGGSHILLESTNAGGTSSSTGDVRGRYSILALDVESAPRYEYTVGKDTVSIFDQDRREIDLEPSGGIWPFLAHHLEKNHTEEGNINSPFWGGFMGYTTYELGLETIDVQSQHKTHEYRPDICLAWITRSIVIDHVKMVIHIQELATRTSTPSQGWINNMVERIKILQEPQCSAPHSPCGSTYSESCGPDIPNTPASTPPRSSSPRHGLGRKMFTTPIMSIDKPTNDVYESKVIQCQEFISAGDSYELCLTDQTIVSRPQPTTPVPSWALYKHLRSRQPAPFASYIRLGSGTLVSSSPERFLTWDENNFCSLRPMKGTVRKTTEVDTLEKAKKLLDVPKEKAENLMIVDLVRHDLHGVCGSGNVRVPRLCVVEEYRSVFQMISVVEGQIPAAVGSKRYTGLDVLAASLPPGSMTGAPKKRSCELLQGIEGKERSLYSGVVGYLDVRGRGDWSVTIRSLFKWDDEDTNQMGLDVNGASRTVQMEKWHIGAGGAVTTLSTAVAEREEMQTKLSGTLGLFT